MTSEVAVRLIDLINQFFERLFFELLVIRSFIYPGDQLFGGSFVCMINNCSGSQWFGPLAIQAGSYLGQ